MRAARNIAIIAALAAAIAFLPFGGNAFDVILAALSMALLAGIAGAVAQFAQRNELTLASLNDRDRTLLYGAAGVVVLLLVGTSRFFASGLGTLAWVVLFGASVYIAWRVWQDATTY